MLSSIIVTGEGPTDMGIADNAQGIVSDDDFQCGPIFRLIEKLLEQHLPEWNRGQEITKTFVYRKHLGERAKEMKKFRFPSHYKAMKGHLEHAQRARALAEIAKESEANIAVYFHDTDGTQTELKREPNRQENRVQAVVAGFKAANYKNGIAMVPKPTSEAWLYCTCKQTPYQHCTALETDLSGNDRSPENSPKAKLASALDNEALCRDDLMELVENIKVTEIDMPSFNQFRHDLKIAIEDICGSVEN